MSTRPDFIELLTENIQDWFYTNCNYTCYESDDEFIEDIRYMIVNTNDAMVERCIGDLIEVYDMDPDDLEDYHTSVVEILIKESQDALDSFSYHYKDDTDEDR